MAPLADCDVRVVRELAHLLIDAPLEEVVDRDFLGDLRRAIPSDYADYAELDLDRHRTLTQVSLPIDLRVAEVTFWRVLPEDPVWTYRLRTGQFAAVRYTDCTTMEELRRTQYYEVVVRPNGLERLLSVAIPSPRWHEKSLCVQRRGRDFSERDRTVLDLLIPYVEARVHAVALQRTLDDLRASRQGHERLDCLTAREQEVMGLVSTGCTNAQVAARLSITSLTVRKHLENIFAKLGVHNRTAAVAAARRHTRTDATLA